MQDDKTVVAVVAATMALGLLSAAAVSAQNPSPTPEGQKKENVVQRANKNVTRALGKAGRAVEYSARKTGEQTAVTANRAAGRKSVVRDRGKKQDYVVHPGGTKKPLPKGAQSP
jgi:hypothetical protein